MLILIEYRLMVVMYNAIYGILGVFCTYAHLIWIEQNGGI